MGSKIYVISDIHGEYEKFLNMLDVIRFQDEDLLFVLGDLVDRGPEPMKLLLDLSMRSNIICLLGNHDYIALKMFKALDVEITEDNYDKQLTPEIMQGYMDWMANAGEVTAAQYRRLSAEEKECVLDFLEELSLYELVAVGGKKYILVHGGFMNFRRNRPLDTYAAEELIFCRTDYTKPYFSDVVTITGHTPTLKVTGKPEIYKANNHIDIDCGASWPGGRLACLCLNTMEEFYV